MAAESPFVPRYWELKERRNELRGAADPAWLEAVGYPTYYTPMFTTIPEDRIARWRLVDRFVDFWREKPLTAESGNTAEEIAAREAEIGVAFPTALREWYRLAGRRIDVWTGQDWLRPLAKVAIEDELDALVFRVENQNCERWGVDRTQVSTDDPPVLNVFGERTPQCDAVSIFALQQLIYETAMGSSFTIAYSDQADVLRGWLAESLSRCELPATYWHHHLEFHESTDLLIMDSHVDDYAYAAARTTGAFDGLDEAVRDRFEQV